MAAVVHVGVVLREAELSPLTNPEYDAVTVGTVPPYVIEPDEALITRTALPISTVPPTYEIV